MVDLDEPHDHGNGFDRSVCESCEHHEKNKLGMMVCGLCGCPTARGMPMHLAKSPPESCPYLDEHARADDRV